MGNIVFRFTLAAMITALLATLAHAVFVLPDEITVAGRIDQDGTLRTDVVADGEDTAAPAQPDIIFSENFDAQPNWESASPLEGELSSKLFAPSGWDFVYNHETYRSDNGYPGAKPTLRITNEQPRGGSGKSLILTTEAKSCPSCWMSDGVLGVDLPNGGSSELYIQFWIKYQPGWAYGNNSLQKVFRVLNWNGQSPRFQFFENGNSGPIYIFDWEHNTYGVRHTHSIRCAPQLTNYWCNNPSVNGFGGGSVSNNYLDQSLTPIVNVPPPAIHSDVWGTAWRQVDIHLKMNSAPGVADGVLEYWFDAKLVKRETTVTWLGNGANAALKWNTVMFGGNDFIDFATGQTGAAAEQWYAIDDIIISTSPLLEE